MTKIWPNLTKFRLDLTIFFCIFKHFHRPSWRLSGPETGFCKKKIQNFDKISSKFDQIWQNWTKFFCIIKHFHPASWRLCGPQTRQSNFFPPKKAFCFLERENLTKFRLNWQNLNKIWLYFTKISTKFDQIFE